jgi:hypothetical protein
VRRSIVVASALVIGGVTAVPGSAATSASRACAHLISDARGNAQMWFLPTKPYNPEADLLYFDARTTPTTIVLTATMAKVNPAPTTGTTVLVYFTTDNQGRKGDWDVSIDHQIDGTTASLQNNNTQAVSPLTGSADAATGTYTIIVPRAAIDSTFRGAMLKGLGVIVSQNVGADLANGGFIEQSTGPDHHYRVGFPYGCTHH